MVLFHLVRNIRVGFCPQFKEVVHPNQKLALFCYYIIYLKLINTLMKHIMCIL